MIKADFPTEFENVFFETEQWNNLKNLLQRNNRYSKLFVLVDNNTKEHCLPILSDALEQFQIDFSVLEVKAGEDSKNLNTCEILWEALTESSADRNCALINLGGGMISDLGAFVASIYKRGVDFITIPTSLLGMIDASIGGKCGVDFHFYKNQLGLFSFPKATLIFPPFLKTMNNKELRSGWAEAIKHGLIADETYFHEILSSDVKKKEIENAIILKSIAIKSNLVALDMKDKAERRKLNFGHTIGHAIESYFLEKKETIPHGFAIAAGMICESYISMKLLSFQERELEKVVSLITSIYELPLFSEDEIPAIIERLGQDKKRIDQQHQFVLLTAIGTSKVDQVVDEQWVRESLQFYIEQL